MAGAYDQKAGKPRCAIGTSDPGRTGGATRPSDHVDRSTRARGFDHSRMSSAAGRRREVGSIRRLAAGGDAAPIVVPVNCAVQDRWSASSAPTPKFFASGFAMHADSDVPPYPTSHGRLQVSECRGDRLDLGRERDPAVPRSRYTDRPDAQRLPVKQAPVTLDHLLTLGSFVGPADLIPQRTSPA